MEPNVFHTDYRRCFMMCSYTLSKMSFTFNHAWTLCYFAFFLSLKFLREIYDQESNLNAKVGLLRFGKQLKSVRFLRRSSRHQLARHQEKVVEVN